MKCSKISDSGRPLGVLRNFATVAVPPSGGESTFIPRPIASFLCGVPGAWARVDYRPTHSSEIELGFQHIQLDLISKVVQCRLRALHVGTSLLSRSSVVKHHNAPLPITRPAEFRVVARPTSTVKFQFDQSLRPLTVRLLHLVFNVRL